MTNGVELRMIGIIILLFSISLVPEIVNLDFTIELRALVFAVLVCSLILKIGLVDPLNNELVVKLKRKFTSIDIAYIATIGLTIISFVMKVQNINAFHFAFVAVGMLVVYFAVRFANLDDILLPSKIIYNVVGIAFIIAVIGLVQFIMDKPVISTFGRTSFLGCFLAMNVPLAFGLLLATRNVPLESNRLSVIGNRLLVNCLINPN